MKQIRISAAVILGYAIACWSLTYYEASGQTQVFTLTAGAKIGPTAINNRSISRIEKNDGINFATTLSGIVIMFSPLQSRRINIELYNLSGHQIYQRRGYFGKSICIETNAIATGIYTANVCVNGKNYSHRFAVIR
jgi:hypothetical protein